MKKKTRIFIILILTAGLIFGGGSYIAQTVIKARTTAVLSGIGFENATIGSMNYYSDGIAVNNIGLDSDGFSTINSISSGYGALLGTTNTGNIIIDRLSLSGTLNFPGGLDIAGWKAPQGQWHFPAHNLILNDARMDLMTPNGGIRLQAKGITKKQDDGTLSVEGALWGVQHQLNLDTRWSGTIRPDGTQSFDINILKGTLHLDYLTVSRMSGKAEMSWTTNEKHPSFNGSLVMGKLDIAGIPLTSAQVEFNGPLNRQTIVLQAYIPGKNVMQAGIRLEQSESDTQVQAAINARHLDDLLGFLGQLRANINQSTWGVGIFMPLMLTQGNLDRIKNDMKGIEYDELQLSVTGSIHDMTGKIIAYRKDGHSGAKHIISLDPGFTE